MKKLTVVLACIIFQTDFSLAQGILNKVKNKAEQRANQKADQAIEKGLDKAEEAVSQKNETSRDKTTTSTETQPTPEATGTSATQATAKPFAELPMKAYASFDFTPGDSVIFEDDFRNESLDEIPSLWVPAGGTVEITKVNGQTVAGFLDGFYTGMYPRMKKYNYLPQRFSAEFDYLFTANNKRPWSKYIGDGGSAGLSVVFHSKDQDANSDILGDYQNEVRIESHGVVSFLEFKGKYKGMTSDFEDSEIYDRWVHVSVAGTERGIKVYLNNQRVLNAPVASGKAASIFINGEGNTTEPDGRQLFIRNVRIASGGKDPYKQLTSAAKTYIARGITFDYNKATLKPESMGELNKIYGMMKEHPELKFEIGGHTDADGDDAYNLSLSRQRADTVKEKLVEMGVDTGRLATKGYGETKPVASNETQEGRANNRRVALVTK